MSKKAVETPPFYFITVYFPHGDYKRMLTLEKGINKMYEDQGAKALVLWDEKIGVLIISGDNKDAVVKGAVFVANELSQKKNKPLCVQ